MILNGPHQHRLALRRIQQRLKQERGGRLAVGPRDSRGRELALRMSKESRRSLGQRAPSVFHLEHRQPGFEDQQMIELLRRIGNDAERARGNCLFHVTVAVRRAALHGDKDRPLPHLARVVLDACHRLFRVPARADSCYFFRYLFPIHLVVNCRLLRSHPLLSAV